MFTANDEITLEYNDSILLTYTPSAAGLIPGVEGAGEYVRDTAIVRIIDNDSKTTMCVIPMSDPVSLCSSGDKL